MKHFNILKKSFFAFIAGAFFYSANAQTARFQLIHNAADPALDTVDIYINGSKLDNVTFRQATPIITAALTVKININDRNSIDSSDMVLTRFTQTFTTNSNAVIMLAGVANTSNFTANPNGISTGLQLVTKLISNWAAAVGKVQVNIFHGTSDVAGVDIFANPTVSSGTLPVNLRFAQANTGTQAVFFSNVPTYLEARFTGTRSVLKAYNANLTLFNQKMLSIFTSGFVNPTANQNGQSFGIFAADTNGNVIELPAATRIQLINNAADSALRNVDVYFNHTKVVAALNFRNATPFITANAGNTEVIVSTVNRTDTLLYIPNVFLASGKSYLAMAMGLKDTTSFASNPDGINRMFNITGYDSMPEGSLLSGSFQYLVANGNTDAVQLSFNKVATQTAIISNLLYANFSALRTDNSNFVFNISNQTKTAYNGSYLLSAANYLNQSGVLFTSGFYGAAGNPANAATFKVMLALNNGTVIELPRLQNKIQFIHNSPDTTIRKIDVYANGVKIVNDLGFRKATGAGAGTDAYVPVRIQITRGNATDTTNALWAISLLPDSNFNVAVAHGFTGVSYRKNPEGISTNFAVKLISPAKISATSPSPSNEVIFFHGGVNVGKMDIQGDQEGLFLVQHNSYGTVYKYNPTRGNSGASYLINDGANGNGLLSTKVNFVGKNGWAGVMFASGILLDLRTHIDSILFEGKYVRHDTAYNKLDSIFNKVDSNLAMGFYIAWSNGTVDSFETVRFRTGTKEIVFENNSFSMYPNPTKEKVSIVVNANQKSEGNVNVFDLKGTLLKSINTKLVSGINTIELLVNDLPKGMYFVQINSSESTLTKKLIIE